MATSAFKSATRRAPIDSPTSSASSKPHRRSRSLSRFSRPEIGPAVVPTPRRKFVNTVRGTDFPEISLDDLAIEFFSGNDNSSELDDNESASSKSTRPVHVKSEISPASSHRRSRSVSRHPNDANSPVPCSGSTTVSTQRRGRSVSRRNDGNTATSIAGGTTRVVPNAGRRRSVSVARHQITDAESDIDFSWSSASQPKSRSMNNGNSRVPSFQRPTASSHRRLTRSLSQAPQMRSHDDYSSQSSALTDDDLRDERYGRNGIEKTIQAVYAQKKIDHPTGDDANLGLCEAMKKELRSAVNEIMIELEQNMERNPSISSVHDRLYSRKYDATTRKNHTTKLKQLEKHKQDLSAKKALEEQVVQDGFKVVREVSTESKGNAFEHKASYPRKRSNDRNRVSKRLNEEAEKYIEEFISNVEDTDLSSFDGERSDTSSCLLRTTTRSKHENGSSINSSIPVGMEGVNLPWLKWDDNDSIITVTPTTAKTKLWDPKMIEEHAPAISTNTKNRNGARFDINKYRELERTEELLLDSWRYRNAISSGRLLLCTIVVPFGI